MNHLLFKTDQLAKLTKVGQVIFEPVPRRPVAAQPDERVLNGLRLSKNAGNGMCDHSVSPALKRPLRDQRSFSALHHVDKKRSIGKGVRNPANFPERPRCFDE